MANLNLMQRTAAGGTITPMDSGGWRLEIPAGPAGLYRWAQLDDYAALRRKDFPHRAPLRMRLRARVSAADLPGTWGFGFWNDPFNMSFGLGGMNRRLPALPNTAWYFYAAPPNYLAFQDTHPAQGLLAATFRAARIPTLLLALGAVALPLAFLRPTARLLRKLARRVIGEDGSLVNADPTTWHDYQLDWLPERVLYRVDGAAVFETSVSPRAPLAFVLWIDNQYAAFPPSGRVAMGTSANPSPAWLEVENITIS